MWVSRDKAKKGYYSKSCYYLWEDEPIMDNVGRYYGAYGRMDPVGFYSAAKWPFSKFQPGECKKVIGLTLAKD